MDLHSFFSALAAVFDRIFCLFAELSNIKDITNMIDHATLPSLCEQALPIIQATGDFILRELGKVSTESIEEKSLNSLVSYVDKTAERQLVEGLQKLLPAATFITEEDTIANQESDLQWIIDPLDGTTNFLHQLPCFAVSVGLRSKGELVLGIVLEVNRKECFYAWKGGGAFLNGKPISVSKTPTLGDALIATGFPYHAYDHMQPFLQAFEHFMRHSRGVRRWGAAAVDLAYVACGRFDTFFEYGLSAWDIAGSALIVQEAGGIVTNFKGTDDYLFPGDVVAGNPTVAKAVQEVVGRYF